MWAARQVPAPSRPDRPLGSTALTVMMTVMRLGKGYAGRGPTFTVDEL